ncbi:MAG: hypothetical protein FD130_1662 [Halothiobacillaceae bacterium]|nr:MAG: hypothetical protein FD130_1662 [Halothiobacillaceae bacterium]
MEQQIEVVGEEALSATKRRFLQLFAAGMALSMMPSLAEARRNPNERARRRAPSERSLSFYNLHTGEKLKTVYWSKGIYHPEAFEEINYFMRDHRNDQIKAIDHHLLNLLYSVKTKLATTQPFHVISAYRSPATNRLLAEHSDGVAKRSLHMEGQAIDVFVPGRALRQVRRAALALKGGGVGYYPKDNFVHLDTGRVRRWS